MSMTGLHLRRRLRDGLDHLISTLEALDAPPDSGAAPEADAPTPAADATPAVAPTHQAAPAAQPNDTPAGSGHEAPGDAPAPTTPPGRQAEPVSKLTPLPTLNTRRPTRSLKRDTSAVLATPPTAILDTPTPPRPTKPKAPAPPVEATGPADEADANLTPAGRKAKQSPEARQKAHWAKARAGILRFVHDQGGKASLRELHDHSERTWFIAHQSFSRMMEELTDEELLEFDHDTATATLTPAGVAELD